jgi:hypothetical protein
MRSSALLTWPNRRMRTRMSGGVGGGSREVSPYPDFSARPLGAIVCSIEDVILFL